MNTVLLNTVSLDGDKVIVKKGGYSGGGGDSMVLSILSFGNNSLSVKACGFDLIDGRIRGNYRHDGDEYSLDVDRKTINISIDGSNDDRVKGTVVFTPKGDTHTIYNVYSVSSNVDVVIYDYNNGEPLEKALVKAGETYIFNTKEIYSPFINGWIIEETK